MPSHFCNEINNFDHPEFFKCGKQNIKYTFQSNDTISPNGINLKTPEKKNIYKNLIQDYLVENGTQLKIEVHFAAPLFASGRESLISTADLVTRMFLIFFDRKFFYHILNIILKANCNSLGTKTRIPIPFQKPTLQPTKELLDLEELDVITGFTVDNQESQALFIEGKSSGLIAKIWNDLMHLDETIVKLHFNTSLLFMDRLYKTFVPIGAILEIRLVFPLQHILKQRLFYLKGNVPLGCWRVKTKKREIKRLRICYVSGYFKVGSAV